MQNLTNSFFTAKENVFFTATFQTERSEIQVRNQEEILSSEDG